MLRPCCAVVAVHSAKPVDNSILFGDDEDNSTILYNNLESAIGWDNYTDYDFILDHNQGVFSIDIRDGDAVVDSFVVQNHRYASGRFGFFNYSQGNVYYEGFAGEQVGEYTYRYDVNAMDMDFDPIEFAGGIVLHEESCRYDALGRRIQIVSDGEETIRVYEGTHFSANDLARFNTDGEAVQRFLFTDSVDQLVAQWTLGQGVTWALSDQLGSIRDLVNNAGHSIEHVYYRAFGSPAIEGSATDPSRILFASRGYSELTGLYFNRTRFYHPSIGRFANRDTLGFQAGDHNLHPWSPITQVPTTLMNPTAAPPHSLSTASSPGLACSSSPWDQFSLCGRSGRSRSADEWVSWSFVQVVFETSIIAEGGSPNLQDCFGPVWIVPEHFSAFDS